MKLIHLTEALFAGAAYKNIHTGEIYGPDGTHASVLWGASGGDEEEEARLFDMYDNGDLIAGFLTTDHRFMTRLEAGKYAEMERDERRQRLDSDDPEFQNNVDSSMWESVEHITERRMVGAAYKDLKTGKVYGPAITHGTIQNDDEELKHDFDYNTLGFDQFYDRLGAMMDAGRIVDGFLTDDGEFMSRQDAAKAIQLQKQKAELGHRHGLKRDWLDSGDLTHLNPTVVEANRKMAGAAMIDHQTGKIYGPAFAHIDLIHSNEVRSDFDPENKMSFGKYEDLIWKLMDAKRLEDGFVDDAGKWYTRTDAAKAVRLDPSKTDQPGDRDWLDAWDLNTGFDTIHESSTGFSGYALDDVAKQTLLSRIEPIFGQVSAHHVTHLYGGPEELPPDARTARVIAVVQDDRAQAAIVEINGTTERPNGQTYHITISYDKAGGASAKDSNQAIMNSEWQPVKPFELSVQPQWFPNKKTPAAVVEDTEKDLQTSQFLSRLVREFRKGVRQHLTTPIFDAEDHFFTNAGEVQASFHGEDFGFPEEFADLWIVLRGDHTQPTAGFHSYDHDDGTVERVISFAVLPKMVNGMSRQDQLNAGLTKLASDKWSEYMLHELVHVTQDMRGIPMGGKGNYVDGKKPSKIDYFNSPVEFDAYYQQLTHGYHTLLGLLRENPAKGMDIAGKIGYRTDFETALESMLPSDPKRPEWGMVFYGKLKQNRRLIKRLYALHQAILKEMKKLLVNENSDHDDHQDALNKTGFWGKAGAGCLIMAADTKRILLPRRSQWVQEPGTWGTWGGAIDQGEDPQEAALREVEEEAGYSGGVQKMIHLYRFQSGEFRYDTFLAIVQSEFEPNLNWETDQADWFALGDFPKPLHFGLDAVLKDTSAQNKLGNATSA